MAAERIAALYRSIYGEQRFRAGSFRFIDEAATSETHEIYRASLSQGLLIFRWRNWHFGCLPYSRAYPFLYRIAPLQARCIWDLITLLVGTDAVPARATNGYAKGVSIRYRPYHDMCV